MYFESDSKQWAEEVFGRCELGDARRVNRLIEFAALQAKHPGSSVSCACKGNEAAREGAYRLLRNDAVRPEDIEEGVFETTAKYAQDAGVCLAIQDSTGVSFKHSVAEEMQLKGSPTGFMVHSTLLVEAKNRQPIGLLDQERWIRKTINTQSKKERENTAYKNKESYKWESACNRIVQRLRTTKNIINVCDRESDIFEFLQYHKKGNYRCVLRASHNRALDAKKEYLWQKVEKQLVLGTRKISISQRGGQRQNIAEGQQARKSRSAREAILELKATQVAIRPPTRNNVEDRSPVTINVVQAKEANPPAETEAVSWILLTTEPISTLKEVQTIIDYYETRWLIEEFHKAWKSGCNIQKRTLQTEENLERIMTITAPIAVRLLQLRNAQKESSEKDSCEKIVTKDEWQCLFVLSNPGKSLPKKPPTAKWTLLAIARLGGWFDTKKTGRVGWDTLWKGWDVFQNNLIGWQAARAMNSHV